MTGLNQFLSFDFARFCQGKRFITTASKAWVDHDTHQHLGTVVAVAITEDQTAYKPGKDGKAISNLYEKMNWKIGRDVNIPIGVQVVPVDGVATIYGDYRNLLSVRVADIKVVQATAPVSGGKPSAPVTSGKALG